MTALWKAVVDRRAEEARARAVAGADPWQAVLGGWSHVATTGGRDHR
ncbi:hypothetical protein ACPCAA_07400 [Streptomyces griseoincarnatus]